MLKAKRQTLNAKTMPIVALVLGVLHYAFSV